MGALRDLLLSRRGRRPAVAGPSILDSYVKSVPSPQNAVDVFAGEWSSTLPVDGVEAGPLPLFDDDRLHWALERFGELSGRSVLELGPLEGGHTYLLDRAGARVLAVEGQTRAYLRCLIAKELLGMPGSRFVLGDFNAYLRDTTATFDACVACGVLCNVRDPVETLVMISKVTSRLFLWTHYYDADIVNASDLLRPRLSEHEQADHTGFPHTEHYSKVRPTSVGNASHLGEVRPVGLFRIVLTLYRFDYDSALELKGYCGGNAEYANWLSRDDLLDALVHLGWHVDDIGFDIPDHPHGPALALVATK